MGHNASFIPCFREVARSSVLFPMGLGEMLND